MKIPHLLFQAEEHILISWQSHFSGKLKMAVQVNLDITFMI